MSTPTRPRGGTKGVEEGGGGISGKLVAVTLTLNKGAAMVDARTMTEPTKAVGALTSAVEVTSRTGTTRGLNIGVELRRGHVQVLKQSTLECDQGDK